MLFRLLADAILILHLAFVVFVVLGGLLVLRWPQLIWLHIPAAAWGVLIELTGWGCPLTPLEKHFRQLGGEAGYEGSFIEHYIMAVIYPGGLTREMQYVLGGFVLLINTAVYVYFIRSRRQRQPAGTS